MNERLKLLSTEESHKAGNYDAEKLLVALRNIEEGDDAACLLADAMNDIMALAFDNRTEESVDRLDGFCAVIGPALERSAALEAKCALLSASLNKAEILARSCITRSAVTTSRPASPMETRWPLLSQPSICI